MARQQVFYPLIGELIGPLIFGMPRMPLDPMPFYSMPRQFASLGAARLEATA
jgi:hypothetical protein